MSVHAASSAAREPVAAGVTAPAAPAPVAPASPGAPKPPAAGPTRRVARGHRLLLGAERALAACDRGLGRWIPPEWNPFVQAGQATNAALLIAVVSGVAMLLWYSPSLQFAYSSLAGASAGTVGGVVRGVHRYSADLMMLFLLVHAVRVFVVRKFTGARWLPWVSGIGLLGVVWFIGWTGYWLVWDQPAQQVAVTSMRLLDGIPIFGEPLGRLYVSDRTVPSLLFFVVFFLHMLLPLTIAVGLAIHLARVGRVRLMPPRGLTALLCGALVLAAILAPAPLDQPAQMAVKPASLVVDSWYLWPLALSLRLQDAGLWLSLAGIVVLGTTVPWWLSRRAPAPTGGAESTVARGAGPVASAAAVEPTRSPRVALGVLAVVLVAVVVSVVPSLGRLSNPASPEPELVLSFKVLADLIPQGAAAAVVDESTPVHMRGRAVEKPRRHEVVVQLTVGGQTWERRYEAKGISHDGPAIGEWRVPLQRGPQTVAIDLHLGPGHTQRWQGVVTGEERRLRVITYETAGGWLAE